MDRLEFLLWIVVPYACLTVFVVGHIWRYRTDQGGWTAQSTQIMESRMLRLGSPLFHAGLLAVAGGHVLGLLIPQAWTEALGVDEDSYHLLAVVGGSLAGLAMIAGFAILIYRRTTNLRVRATTSRMDLVAYGLLLFIVLTGLWAVLGENLILGEYAYRETVSPWFRGIFQMTPDSGLMAGAPLTYQLHALAAFGLFALWPFTRLVHAWSVPLRFPARRAQILYRRRGQVRPELVSAARSTAPPRQQ